MTWSCSGCTTTTALLLLVLLVLLLFVVLQMSHSRSLQMNCCSMFQRVYMCSVLAGSCTCWLGGAASPGIRRCRRLV
jgi:hypothetical protein